MNFPDKLKELRKQKGLTQEELAKQIYVSRTLISRYENGVVYPSRENIEKLALFFNVRISDLIDEEDTASLTLKQLDTIHKLNLVLSIVILIICSLAIIFSFLPILKAYYYDYANYEYQPGVAPNRVYTVFSAIEITLKNNNPIVLISMISCFINMVLSSLSIKLKNNVWIRFSSYVLFVLNIFLIFFSIVFSVGYTSSYMGDL